MLRATPAKTKRRARDQCYGQSYVPPRRVAALRSVTKSGGYIVDDETGRYREFKYRTKCPEGGSGKWHRVVVRFYGSLNMNTRVWCWCDCSYFKYNCEVALASKGSSAVIQSNGQRPRHTNSRLEPRVCKHVFLVFSLAMRKRKPGKAEKNQPSGRRQKKLTLRAVWAGDALRGPQGASRREVPPG
jgi:hypothetical protein